MPEDSNAYRVVPIRINGQAPSAEGALELMGSRLTTYGNEAAPGSVRVASVEQDEGFGCTDSGSITLDRNTGPRIREPSFIGTFSPDPGHRFSQRPTAPQERNQLLKVASLPEAYSSLLENAREDPDTLQDSLTIVTDNVSGHEFAVLSLSASQEPGATSDLASPIITTGFFGVFERTGDSSWQARFSRHHSGCDDCEARPETFGLVAYGDFNQDGNLDFLLIREGYESWEYVVLWNSSQTWQIESLVGGGC